jgi:hypothetical protein
MQKSSDRILTSHVGSLPRPEKLIALNSQRASGELSETALRALLKVDPESEATEHVAAPEERCPKTWMGKRCMLRKGHFGPCHYQA